MALLLQWLYKGVAGSKVPIPSNCEIFLILFFILRNLGHASIQGFGLSPAWAFCPCLSNAVFYILIPPACQERRGVKGIAEFKVGVWGVAFFYSKETSNKDYVGVLGGDSAETER